MRSRTRRRYPQRPGRRLRIRPATPDPAGPLRYAFVIARFVRRPRRALRVASVTSRPNGEPLVRLSGVNKWFGDLHVLQDIDLDDRPRRGRRRHRPVRARASRRCAARSTGSSRSRRARSRSTACSCPRRARQLARLRSDVGMVFQSFNLFAHKTILENVTLGPIKVRGKSKAEAEKRARELLERVGVERAGRQVPGAALRRPAAARRDRPGAGDGPEGDALRRADVGPGPGDDQRGPRRDDLAGPGRHDDDRRHPRDGLRPQGGQPGRVHGRRPHRRVRGPRDLLHATRRPTGPRTSCPRSSPTDHPKGSPMRITRYAATLAAFGLVLTGCASEAGNQAAESTETTADGRGGRVRGRHHDGRAHRGRRDHRRHQVRPARLRPDEPATSEPEGFDVEIAKLIAAKLGIEADDIEWTETVSANREPFIENGQVDIVVATYTINDKRKEVDRLRRAVLRGRPGHHGRQGQPRGHRRARTTWPARRSARSRARRRPQNIRDNYPEAQLTTYDVYSKCADDLKNGQVAGRHHRQRHPHRPGRRQPGRLRARRQPVHRGAVRHRPDEGRRRVPRLHQRRARGVLRGRHLGRGLGPHRR